MLCLQFRSQRSSAWCVLLERCVMVSALTLLYTHMPAWQQGTQSWSLMEPVCVKQPFLCCSMFFYIDKSWYQRSFLYFPLPAAVWPYLYPVGLLPWSESSDHITLSAKTHIPGATTTQCWYNKYSTFKWIWIFKYTYTFFSYSLLFYFDILIKKKLKLLWISRVFFISGTKIF